MTMKNVLLVALTALAILFIIQWRHAARRQNVEPGADKRRPSLIQIAIGFATDFFDTLGIGSFATTTTAFKLLRVVTDERMVGTLLVGHSLTVAGPDLLFIFRVYFDPVYLLSITG